MKKRILFATILVALICITVVFCSCGGDSKPKYELSSDGSYYILSSTFGLWPDEFIIPTTYKGKPVKEIGEDAFRWSNLKTITIPSSITKIGEDAFSLSEDLTAVIFEDGSQLVEIDGDAFDGCGSLCEINLENCQQLTSIGEEAFCDCSFMEVTIPKSVTYIGEDAFSEKSVVYFEADSFDLISIWPELDDYSLSSEKPPVIFDCKNNNVALDGYIYKIENGLQYALKGLTAKVVDYSSKLSEVHILASVTEDNEAYAVAEIGVVYWGNISKFTVDTNNAFYKSIDGVLYSNDGEVLIKYPPKKEDAQFKIPSNVNVIEEYSFYGCEYLKEIDFIGSNITVIGNYAFGNCDSIETVIIPGTVSGIGKGAFYDCNKIKTVYFQAGRELIVVLDEAFSGCNNLSSVLFEECFDYVSFGDDVFRYCNIKAITIPKGAIVMGENMFSGCRDLEAIFCESEEPMSGWDEGWNVNWDDSTQPTYYYREHRPSEPGNYWHYDSNGICVIWY